jgi:aminoglycoside 6'-N-acetyltransferase I
LIIRQLDGRDIPGWIELRTRLWPDESASELEAEGRRALRGDPPLIVRVAEETGRLIGFIEIGLRSYAEGCSSSPVPYVEGWYVVPERRRQGVGAALMRAAEMWASQAGYVELGSDTQPANQGSQAAHAALGFEEVEQLVVFRKALGTDTASPSQRTRNDGMGPGERSPGP